MSYVAVGVSVAMIVAGTAINYYNTEQTEKKAQDTEANEINQQTALDKKANADTQAMLQKDAANDSDTSQRSALMNQFQTALKANSATATGGLNQVGNVSSAYTKAANDAASGISEYANSQAGNLSNMLAPTLQRQNENAALANYGSQIGAISQQSQGDAALANIKLQGIQANPWLSAVGNGLEAYGSSSLGSAGGGMLTGGGSGSFGGYPTTTNANGQPVLALNPNAAGTQITYN
jgi:hypothetical protein